MPADAIAYYVGMLSNPESLHGSLGWYRAFGATLAQNDQRASRPLTMPVLAIGGERSYGDHVEHAMHALAENVQGLVIPGAGHWVAYEAADAFNETLTELLTSR